MKFSEPFLESRLKDAEAKAKLIDHGQLNDEDDMRLRFQWFLCRQLHKGFWDPYFEDLTIEQLAFEVYLWVESTRVGASKATKMEEANSLLKDNPEEAKELFNDWKDELLPDVSDTEFIEQAKKDFESWGVK